MHATCSPRRDRLRTEFPETPLEAVLHSRVRASMSASGIYRRESPRLAKFALTAARDDRMKIGHPWPKNSVVRRLGASLSRRDEAKLRIQRRRGGVPRSLLHGKEFPTAPLPRGPAAQRCPSAGGFRAKHGKTRADDHDALRAAVARCTLHYRFLTSHCRAACHRHR